MTPFNWRAQFIRHKNFKKRIFTGPTWTLGSQVHFPPTTCPWPSQPTAEFNCKHQYQHAHNGNVFYKNKMKS